MKDEENDQGVDPLSTTLHRICSLIYPMNKEGALDFHYRHEAALSDFIEKTGQLFISDVGSTLIDMIFSR